MLFKQEGRQVWVHHPSLRCLAQLYLWLLICGFRTNFENNRNSYFALRSGTFKERD